MERELEKKYRDRLKQSIKAIEKEYADKTDETVLEYGNIVESEYKIARRIANFILAHPDFTDKDIQDIIGKRLERFKFIKEMFKAEPNLVNEIKQNGVESVLKKIDIMREKIHESTENKNI